MTKFEPEMEFDEEKRLIKISGELMAIHCHHYNVNLFQMLETADYVDGMNILYKAVEKVANNQFVDYLKKHSLPSVEEKLEVAADLYRTFAFGSLNFAGLNGSESGEVTAPSSHICTGWVSKFGKRSKPLCYFTAAFVAGVLEAINGKPLGSYKVTETQCISMGANECKFKVESV